MIKRQGKTVEIHAFSIIERTLAQSYFESLNRIDKILHNLTPVKDEVTKRQPY